MVVTAKKKGKEKKAKMSIDLSREQILKLIKQLPNEEIVKLLCEIQTLVDKMENVNLEKTEAKESGNRLVTIAQIEKWEKEAAANTIKIEMTLEEELAALRQLQGR